MVELFTVGFFGRTPSVVIRPVARVSARKLPTTAKVVRAFLAKEARTPWRDWFAARERHPFENHGCPRGQSVPVAQARNLKKKEKPVLGMNLWDRDRRLIVRWFEQVYLRKPPSNRTSVSPRIRLYVPLTGGG